MPMECHFQKGTLFCISVLDFYVGSVWQLATVVPEAEAGGFLLLVQGQPSQHGELKDSLGLPRENLP